MTKFATRVIDEIKALEIVEQLCIYGVGQLDLLEEKIVGTTYSGEFKGLLSFIQHFANGGNPGRKVKYLRGVDGTTEFEIISKHLRIYAIQRSARKLIIYGGLKKAADSSDNIEVFRVIKREYLFFIKQKK